MSRPGRYRVDDDGAIVPQRFEVDECGGMRLVDDAPLLDRSFGRVTVVIESDELGRSQASREIRVPLEGPVGADDAVARLWLQMQVADAAAGFAVEHAVEALALGGLAADPRFMTFTIETGVLRDLAEAQQAYRRVRGGQVAGRAADRLCEAAGHVVGRLLGWA